MLDIILATLITTARAHPQPTPRPTRTTQPSPTPPTREKPGKVPPYFVPNRRQPPTTSPPRRPITPRIPNTPYQV